MTRLAHAVALAALLSACGAGKAPASAPSAASPPAAEPASRAPTPQTDKDRAAESRSEDSAAPAAPTMPSTQRPAQGAAGAFAPAPSGRAVAIQSAAREVESAQRELDVAAGDCRNACRALGSMDRATGRLCGLAQGDVEGLRCDEAKRRVYSARDRVKATCGTCEGGPSVDRAAPIPSLR